MTDISQLSRAELQELQAKIAARMQETEKQALAEAKVQIGEIANGLGRSVQQLLADLGLAGVNSSVRGAKPRADAGKKVAPIYHNPANPSDSWTGRGRQPKWVKEYLDSGKSLDDLRITH